MFLGLTRHSPPSLSAPGSRVEVREGPGGPLGWLKQGRLVLLGLAGQGGLHAVHHNLQGHVLTCCCAACHVWLCRLEALKACSLGVPCCVCEVLLCSQAVFESGPVIQFVAPVL